MDPNVPPPISRGIAIAIALSMLGWAIYRMGAGAGATSLVLVAAVAFAVTYMARPTWRSKMLESFQIATYPVRWLATFISMAIMFYVVVTPIAIWFRIRGKSIRQSEWDKTSNWKPLSSPDEDSYFRMY